MSDKLENVIGQDIGKILVEFEAETGAKFTFDTAGVPEKSPRCQKSVHGLLMDLRLRFERWLRDRYLIQPKPDACTDYRGGCLEGEHHVGPILEVGTIVRLRDGENGVIVSVEQGDFAFAYAYTVNVRGMNRYVRTDALTPIGDRKVRVG